MGTIARYLVPIDSKLSASEYADRAMKVLLEMEVISESPERNKELFYNGARSTEPFQMEPDDDEYGFDMGGVFGGPGFILAPEEYVGGAWCPKCNAEITEQWAPYLRTDKKRVEHESSIVKMSCPE